jgi:Trypsin-like peptidase domain
VSVISVISLYTEITVKTAICQAFFRRLLYDSRKHKVEERVLTPVPFPAFSPIYSRNSLCQSMASEDVVPLRSAATHHRKAAIAALGALAALVCVLSPIAAHQTQAQANSPEDSAISSVCPVVYPDDQTPASRGYHYTFFGNAFFINDEGYLLTVAHVLETFRDGGQPYILVNRPNSPPKLLQVTVIAKDLQHDVAILRATPNPFMGKYQVAYLPLSVDAAVRGQSVLALSLHPQRLQNAYSFDSTREDSSPGTVLNYESTQLEKSAPAADVFLLSHPVEKGQSGSPVLAVDSRAVVGLIEGLWLRGTPVSVAKSGALSTSTPGAAIPVRYAIAVLQQNGVAWHAAGALSSTPSSSRAPQSGLTASKSAVEQPKKQP